MSVATNVSEIPTLKMRREKLSKSERKIIDRCVAAAELQLIDALPELLNGLEVSGRQSSLSITTTLKKAKGPNVTVLVAPRVRAAREAEEFQVHLTDDNQLELGWLDTSDEEKTRGGNDDDGADEGDGWEE